MEPVDSRAVHHSREFSRSNSQCRSYRRKTQDDFQHSPNFINEEGPAVFSRVDNAGSFNLTKKKSSLYEPKCNVK